MEIIIQVIKNISTIVKKIIGTKIINIFSDINWVEHLITATAILIFFLKQHAVKVVRNPSIKKNTEIPRINFGLSKSF